MLLGAGIGAASGGTIGNLSTDHSAQGTAIGALVGAGLGAAFGYLEHKKHQQKDRLPEAMEHGTQKPKQPRLTAPRYRSLWIPDKIEGDRYIEGHRVFIIEDPGKWTTD
jgi:hypothetical protein